MPTRTFHIVTQRRWMVDELTEALTPAGWRLQAHNGLSALQPEVGHDPAHVLWCPGAFAAREIVHGNPLRLATPGPRWQPALAGVDLSHWTELVTAAEAKRHPREGFWKVADAKWDRFPALWRTEDELLADLVSAELPDGSLLHFKPHRLRAPVVREFRSIVAHGEVLTTSCYLDPKGRDRSDPDFVEPHRVVQATAEKNARVQVQSIAELRDSRWRPADADPGPAYSLDLTYSGELIEANPVWSSAWYGCDLVAFAGAVAAAQGDQVPDEHVWRPDPVLAERASRTPKLPAAAFISPTGP